MDILARMTWTQFLALFDAYGPIVGFLVALLLLGFLLRKSWPTITQFVTSVNVVASLPAKLKAIDDTLTTLTNGQATLTAGQAHISEAVGEIRHEVQTNSGGSLNDSVKRTEKAVKSLQGTVRNMSGRVTAIEQGQRLAAEVATTRSEQQKPSDAA